MDKCLVWEAFMSKEEQKLLETYRQLKPELKQDVLAYSHGSLSCQRRLENKGEIQRKEAERPVVTESKSA
jgi:hypothetical protein